MTGTNWRKSTYSSSGGANCVEVGTWRKSTYSGSNGGACVEVANTWRKSTYSSNGGANCVEVAAAGAVFVRDTTDRGGVTLNIPSSVWTTFLATV
jgi:hypothetical protein